MAMQDMARGSEDMATPVALLSPADLATGRFVRDHRRPGRPALIRGLFPSGRLWDLDRLAGLMADRVLPVRHYGPDRFTRPKTEWKNYCDVQMLTVADFAGHLRSGHAKAENLYMAQVNLQDSPAVADIADVLTALADGCGFRPVPQLNLWLGPGGHTEPLHFDRHDGTMLQIWGRKRVVLFAPGQTGNLYPFGFFSGGLPPWFSRPYIQNPDYQQYPRLAEAMANRWEAVLEPGDILFIPAGWWHEVSAVGGESVCSLNRFWPVDPIRRAFATPRMAIIYMLSELPMHHVLALHGRILRLLGRGQARA